MRTFCFDLDGVLCSQTGGDYENAVPDRRAIDLVNRIYAAGDRVIVYTSRYMGRNTGDAARAREDGYARTADQLRSWGVKFHELVMGKPRYDVLVDDKALFFSEEWRAELERLCWRR